MRVVWAALLVVILPVILLIEALALVYQEWQYWRLDLDRAMAKDPGALWSGRLCGLMVQERSYVFVGILSAIAAGAVIMKSWPVVAIFYAVAVGIVWRQWPP